MNKAQFPLYATIIGMVLMTFVIGGSQLGPDGHTRVPLLALLAICEFAFFVCIAGAYIGYGHHKQEANRQNLGMLLACIVLAVLFALRGLVLWPT